MRRIRTEHSGTQNAISIKVVPAGTSERLVNDARSPEEKSKCLGISVMDEPST